MTLAREFFSNQYDSLPIYKKIIFSSGKPSSLSFVEKINTEYAVYNIFIMPWAIPIEHYKYKFYRQFIGVYQLI